MEQGHKNMTYVKANMIIIKAREARLMLATAESCTGGLVAAALTDMPGASMAFDRGFVTYSNTSKITLLGVSADTIADHGAVSAETARAMAEGGLSRSSADICVAVTGIAGPSGDSDSKPLGLVFFACARQGRPVAEIERRFGPLSRAEIRAAAVEQALDLLLAAIEAR